MIVDPGVSDAAKGIAAGVIGTSAASSILTRNPGSTTKLLTIF